MGSPPRGASSSSAAASPLTAAEIASGVVGPTEIPKSPPKWPLRPGVLAYVKGDTKQNICAARSGGGGTATSTMNQSVGSNGPGTTAAVVTESPLNKSTVSYMSTAAGNMQQRQISSGGGINNETMTAPGDRVLRKALKTIVLSEDVAIQVEDDDDDEEDERGAQQQQQQQGHTQQEEGDETNVDELINFTNSNFINRILKRLRWKRSRGGGGIASGFDNRRRSPMTTGPKKTKKSRRRLLLLRKMPLNGLFGSWKSTNSHTELFDSTRHRPAGIKYPSSGNWLSFCSFYSLTHTHYWMSHGGVIVV